MVRHPNCLQDANGRGIRDGFLLTCCDDTRSDDCVRVLALQGRLINSSIDSPLEPQPAPSLHQVSSHRVRIETRWRATCGATKRTTKQRPYEGKGRTNLDTSDLLIENAQVFTDFQWGTLHLDEESACRTSDSLVQLLLTDQRALRREREVIRVALRANF